METSISHKRKHDDSCLDLSVTQLHRRSKPARKLRKLNHEFAIEAPTQKSNRPKWFLLAGGSIGVVLLLLFLVRFEQIKEDFLHHYDQQYNSFLDQSSCDKHSIDAKEILQVLRQRLVGQEAAQLEIEATLAKDSNFSGIALMGSSGLGKSLTAQTIYAVSQPASKQYILMDDHLRKNETWRVINRLKGCGENLIIIDDIAPSDWPAVQHLTSKLQRSSHRVFTIYVFHVSRYTSVHKRDYLPNIEMLRRLLPPTIRPIEFRLLDQTDLDLVIDKVSESLSGGRLSAAQKRQVVESVDLERAGVKHVRAKVSLVVY